MAEEDQQPQSNPSLPLNSEPFSIHFQGFWHRPEVIEAITTFQKHFQALDDDIVIASKPKSGTTWLQALVFTIVNRSHYTFSDSPLNTSHPCDLVPLFEYGLYTNNNVTDHLLINTPSPRLFSTHIPYSSLAESIKLSGARIVYIVRNPCDIIVSLWHFINDSHNLTLEELFEMFCRGEEPFGPHWDHVLEYWKESLERPNKVLFLKYEDMKQDPIPHIKRLAEFIGFPFSAEEAEAGVIEDVSKLCSLQNLKNLKVNKDGKNLYSDKENKIFFRKGNVGDYVNYFTPSMVERFNKIVEEKLSGSGLSLTSKMP